MYQHMCIHNRLADARIEQVMMHEFRGIYTPPYTHEYIDTIYTHISNTELPAKLLDYFYESRTVYVWVTN